VSVDLLPDNSAFVRLTSAALADRHRVGVLHYDHDYDTVAARTDLGFRSVWLASRGSL
jgi:hypothetical protein